MALPAFDAALHHVGLAPHGGSLKGFLLSGAYDLRGQNYGAPTDFGGQRDLVGNPSLSRWTQDDFSGGVYQETWGKDPAAFSSSSNILPAPTERSVRTVPPLVRYAGPGATTDSAARVRRVFAAGGCIFACKADTALSAGWIDRYDLTTNVVTRYTNATYGVGGIPDYWMDFQYDAGEQILYILHNQYIERKLLPGFTNASAHNFQPPSSGVLDSAGLLTSIEVNRGLILFCIGSRLFRVPVPKSSGVSPADADYVYVDRLPGPWVDSCSYFGLTYILCGGEDQPSSVVSYDGVAMNPVTELPYNFEARCITTYAGRVYVGGSGQGVTGDDHYAEMFEITGTSVRLVKNWAMEKDTGAASAASSIDGFAVHEGLLFFGEHAKGLIAYDITTDSFYSGPTLSSPSQELWDKMTSSHGSLYIWGNGSDSSHRGLYRVAVGGDSIGTAYGTVVTSEFAVEPDRAKRFSLLRVLTRRVAAAAEYSIDGGATWTTLSAASTSTRGDLITTSFDLAAVAVSDSIRFRLKMAFTSTSTVGELIALTLGFVFLDTGKLTWQFTVNGAANVELADGSTAPEQDTGLLRSTLLGYFQNRTPLDFTDVDGIAHNVQLTDFRESQPIITENWTASGGTVGREAFYALTLVEV